MTASVSWRKRTGALIAAAALGTTMAFGAVAPAPAWAASIEDGNVTISSTVNEGVTYKAFQLFDAQIAKDGTASAVDWGEGITDDQKAAIAEQLDTLTEGGYTAWLTDKDMTASEDKVKPQNALDFINEQIRKDNFGEGVVVDYDSFAKELADYLQDSGITSAKATEGEQFTGPEGYYLFVTDIDSLGNAGVATAPIWFPLGCNTIEINEKASAPTVEKKTENEGASDAEPGDVLPFTVTATLPSNYAAYDSYKIVLTDTPTNLKILEGVKVMSGENNITEADGVNVNLAADGSSLTVTIDDLKKADKDAKHDTKVTVTYEAELLPDSASTKPGENSNSIKYEFSNDPNGTGTGTIDGDTPVKVYTFLLDLLKQDQNTDEALEGAGFAISNEDNKFFDKDAKTWTLDESVAKDESNLIFTKADGKLQVSGLASGTYTLTEVKAPEGYEAQEGSTLTFTVDVEYDENGDIVPGSFKAEPTSSGLKNDFKTNATNGTISVTVENNKQITLAMTGAEGVGLAGVAVLGLGMAWYLASKRRKGNEQA